MKRKEEKGELEKKMVFQYIDKVKATGILCLLKAMTNIITNQGDDDNDD